MALAEQTKAQLEEQRAIRVKNKSTYQLLGAVLVLLVGIWIGSQRYQNDSGFETNLYTELLSIGVTVFILDRLNARRTKDEARRQRKQELFLQLGSPSNDFALEAIRQLEIEGWLEEALQKKDFPRANWQDVVLPETDFTKADLFRINLTNANFEGFDFTNAGLWEANLTNAELYQANMLNAQITSANLTNANLGQANLTKANLERSNLTATNLWQANMTKANLKQALLKTTILRYANLKYANFEEADLTNADLSGANLLEADLLGAVLKDTVFDERTILPNGRSWTHETDLTRFTDWKQPGLWRSDDRESPAYREYWTFLRTARPLHDTDAESGFQISSSQI